jgi:hypothetical protein
MLVSLELVKDGKYLVTIITRNITSGTAKALEDLGNVKFLEGSFQKEQTLREAMKGHYGVWVNLDGFNLTEGEFYFWAFRMYVSAGEVLNNTRLIISSSLVVMTLPFSQE